MLKIISFSLILSFCIDGTEVSLAVFSEGDELVPTGQHSFSFDRRLIFKKLKKDNKKVKIRTTARGAINIFSFFAILS